MPIDALPAALRDTLAIFERGGPPLATTEVAESLSLGRRSTYDRLDRLADRGRLETKSVGASARVWWQPRAPRTARDRAGPGGSDASRDEAIVAVDDGWRITEVTGAGWLLDGLPSSHADATLWSVLPASAVDAVRERFEGAAASGEPVTVEVTLPSVDERAALTVHPTARGATVVVRDVSDRATLEREHAEYAAILETMQDGVYVVDTEGRFDVVNEAYLELTGFHREDLLGRPAGDLVDDETAETARRLERELVAGERDTATLEADLQRADGSTVRAEAAFSVLPTEDDDQYRRIGVVRDVTDRRERQRQLETQFRQQEAVAALGRTALDREGDLDALLSDASVTVADVLDTAYCEVLELGPEAEELALRQGTGWEPGTVGEATVSAVADDSQAAHTLDAAAPVVVENLDADPRFSGPPLLREHDVTSGISVVVGPTDEPWGVLGTHAAERRSFSEHEVTFVQSVATVLAAAIERRRRERDLERYETLVEESRDVNAVLAPDGTFEYITPSVGNVLGYDRDEVEGEDAFAFVHEDDREATLAEFARTVRDPSYRPTVEFRWEHGDGSWRVVEARGRNLLDDPDIGGIVAYTRDVTERRERERRLEAQRERLATLNQLNTVVQEITHAVVEAADRTSVEATACDLLAAVDAYAAAWIGDLDAETETIRRRVGSGLADRAASEDVAVADAGPAGRALRSGAVETASGADVTARGVAANGDAPEAVAAVPITHEGAEYGVLTVYADSADAFGRDEVPILERLGDVLGHAIRAIERRRALLSEEVVELDVRLPDAVRSATESASATVEEVVPLGDGSYVGYGTANGPGLEALEATVEDVDSWEDLDVLDGASADGGRRFQLWLAEPPAMAAIGRQNGEFRQATLSGGDITMTAHLPQDADVRTVVDGIREAYPDVDLLRQRRGTRTSRSVPGPGEALETDLTERQWTALRVAHAAGYFEWPRETTGEEVAETMDITAPTFHNHLRAAQRKLLADVLGE